MSVVARTLAWLVHLYTATGLLCAAGMAVLIVRGDDVSFRMAFALMMIATAIDATDGWLARRARVKEVLPGFSGRALDDLIDFQTYAAMPLLLIWRADRLPGATAWLLVLPLLASAYGFSQVNAKTDDGYFLGFPSYWNIIAFYLFVLHPPVPIAAALVVAFSVLTFVPTTYIYATQGGPFALLINGGSAVWFVVMGWILWQGSDAARAAAFASLLYPLMYLALSASTASGRTRRRSSAS